MRGALLTLSLLTCTVGGAVIGLDAHPRRVGL